MPEDFPPLPDGEFLALAWPTRRRDLFTHPAAYVACTRANPNYGQPGWTRDAGKRLHRGVDIAPERVRPAGRTVHLMFTDLATGAEYASDEPAWIPEDEAFAVADGVVVEAVTCEADSDFGLHVVLRHTWPACGKAFFTLYGHLGSVAVGLGQVVRAGAALGDLGTTSRIADARNWMAAAPHLHFEARDEKQRRYNPLEFLRRFLMHAGGSRAVAAD